MAKMSANQKILLLDLYPSFSRPYIQPYLYLGAFFDSLHVEYELYRWRDDEEELVARIAQGEFGFVFINLIMGPVLGLVEPVCRLIKRSHPAVQIWVGGIAVVYIRDLLERCPYIDRVSAGHPLRDPVAFAGELGEFGILNDLPSQVGFPLLVTNENIGAFIHQHLRGDRPINAINMSTASKCLHRCTFCYLSRAREWEQPLDRLFEDLSALQEQCDVRYFEFADDNFPADRPRLRSFCARVRRSGLDISYFCLASIDVLDAETLELMVESGLKRLFIGVDAIHPVHIRRLNKNYTPQEIFKTLDLVRSYPIDLTLSVVLGCPGETREQVQELYDWVRSIEPEFCYAPFLAPYPQTPVCRQAVELGFRLPDSLDGWATVADLGKPKPLLNPGIEADEYLEWKKRFNALATYRYRSDIGESLRRLKRAQGPSFPRL